jgi:hypothetical protein
MHGTVRSEGWLWGATGKHPVAKDYITIGKTTQLMGAFSRWVEEGYARVGRHDPHYNWRFFAKGLRPSELMCGLIRDSYDGAGRPFPLLITGYGRLEGWELQWDLLPLVLDILWEKIEFICSKRVLDLEELKRDINRLPSPVLESVFKETPAMDENLSDIHVSGGMVSFHLTGGGDHLGEIIQRLKVFKMHVPAIPDVVFIGGTFDKTFLVGFARSLHATDFEKLWKLDFAYSSQEVY